MQRDTEKTARRMLNISPEATGEKKPMPPHIEGILNNAEKMLGRSPARESIAVVCAIAGYVESGKFDFSGFGIPSVGKDVDLEDMSDAELREEIKKSKLFKSSDVDRADKPKLIEMLVEVKKANHSGK